jgi:hypothetical protein
LFLNVNAFERAGLKNLIFLFFKVGTEFSDRNFSFQVSVSLGSSYRMRSAHFWDNNPEGRRSHLLRGGSLKSRIIQDVYADVSFRLGVHADHSFLECGPKTVEALFLRSVGSSLPNYTAPYLRTSSSVYKHENLKPHNRLQGCERLTASNAQIRKEH